jgi:integrase
MGRQVNLVEAGNMRQPKPYHKHIGKGKNAKGRGWYANIGPNGRPVKLATEEEGETVAWDKYHSLMAGRQPVKADCRVVNLFARFLEYHKLRSADATVDFYANALESFGQFVGNLRVVDLTPQHIDNWIERCHWTVKRVTKKGVVDTGKFTSNNYRRNLIRAVKAAFRWGQRKQKIPNPVADYELPTARPRDTYLTPAQSDKLFAEVAKSRDGGALLDLLTVLRETGCRPAEARSVEARHLDREGRRWLFEREESKGKRVRRIVKLTEIGYLIRC